MTLIFLATKVIVNTGDSPPPSNNIFQIFLQDTTQTSVKVPLMRCICPFDGSYHTAMIRTNPTNRQEGFLGIQRVRNILSPPNEMHFSIGQRVSTERYQQMSTYSKSTIRYQLHSFFTTRIYSGVLDNPLEGSMSFHSFFFSVIL